MKENKKSNEELKEKENIVSSKPRWWHRLWVLFAISIIVSDIIIHILIYTSFILSLFWEFIFFIVLIVLSIDYYLRIRHSIKANKAIYILLGTTLVGFSFAVLYPFTWIPRFLTLVGSLGGYLLNINLIITLFFAGAFIGNWIGKKKDYRLPLGLKFKRYKKKEMRKTKRNTGKIILILISLYTACTINALLIIDNFFIKPRIRYETNYEVNLSYSDELVAKVESFNFTSYLLIRDSFGEVSSPSKFNHNYINGEYVDYLKKKVDRDFSMFHWWPYHSHTLTYLFETTEESLLYFTYNNTIIFKVQNENNEEIFNIESSDNHCYGDDKLCGSWYINFSQVPHTSNPASTVVLNDVVLVKMTLEYFYGYGFLGAEYFKIEQFVVLDSNLQIIFVYIPYAALGMA